MNVTVMHKDGTRPSDIIQNVIRVDCFKPWVYFLTPNGPVSFRINDIQFIVSP